MKRKLFTGAIALSAIFLATQNPALANTFTRQVQSQLINIARRVNSRFKPTHRPVIDQMEGGSSDEFTVNLRSGIQYAVVGVCDEDCSDLDLQVFDSNGNLVASDRDNDDIPVVPISPRWTGQFTVRAEMARCSTNPCYYGVGVFGR
jgi:hypothetical protein